MLLSEYRNISTIKKLPNNPRIIKDEQFKKLCKSIEDNKDYFEARPIILSDRTGELIIIAGNQRYEAAKQLHLQEVPTVLIPNLTEAKEREIIIRDNIANGEWNWETIANEWDTDELEAWGLDLPLFFGKEATEDDYEIPDEIETDIVTGDLFEIGQHRLLCGDSKNSNEVAVLMDGKLADIVFTDPPYGVSIGVKNRFLNSFQKAGRNLTDIKDDSEKPDELYDKLLPCFINLREFSKPECTYFVTSPQGGGIGMMMMMMKAAGLEVRHVLIWRKNSPTFSMGRLDYDYQHEPIFMTWTKKHHYYGKGSQKTSVWDFDKPRSNKEHPTMKPVALMGNALLNNSKEGDICSDFFGGSGSTMVACQQLERRCFMMENDPKYCQVIIDRMLKLDPTIKVLKNGQEYVNSKQLASNSTNG